MNAKVGDAGHLAMQNVKIWMHVGLHVRKIGCGRAIHQVRMFEFCNRVSAASGVVHRVDSSLTNNVEPHVIPMFQNNIPSDLSVAISSIPCMRHLWTDTTSLILEA